MGVNAEPRSQATGDLSVLRPDLSTSPLGDVSYASRFTAARPRSRAPTE